jgi:hypothetical protein
VLHILPFHNLALAFHLQVSKFYPTPQASPPWFLRPHILKTLPLQYQNTIQFLSPLPITDPSTRFAQTFDIIKPPTTSTYSRWITLADLRAGPASLVSLPCQFLRFGFSLPRGRDRICRHPPTTFLGRSRALHHILIPGNHARVCHHAHKRAQ